MGMQIETRFSPGDKVKVKWLMEDSSLDTKYVGIVDTIFTIQFVEGGYVYWLKESNIPISEDCLDLAEPPIKMFVCDKCGQVITFSERCHHINLGRPGYGSGLDGCDVEFNLCDDCLIAFINTFTVEGQEKVHNSGSNAYLDTDTWIKLHKGEMSDEEKEEHGLISNRQRQAYYERYPVCSRVKIKEYNDGSKGSSCGSAFGKGNGEADSLNVWTECYGCESFRQRKDGDPIPVTKA
jgi:hypothetical protein